ncbi:MAG: hypothetical protein ACP5NS_02380 [Candidatus Pacearchaeota archaeon]
MSQKRESWGEENQKNRDISINWRKNSQKRELSYTNDQKTKEDMPRIMNLSEGFMPFGVHRI